MSKEYLNVFQIWDKLERKTPFKVRRWTWHPDTFFEIIKVEITPKNWEYYEKTGNLYGKAFGYMYTRGKKISRDNSIYPKSHIDNYLTSLNNAGSYQWELVE